MYQQVLRDFKLTALKITRRKPHICLCYHSGICDFSLIGVFSLWKNGLVAKQKTQRICQKKLLVYFSSSLTASPSLFSMLFKPPTCSGINCKHSFLLVIHVVCNRRPKGKEKHIILPFSLLCRNWRADLVLMAVSLSLPPESARFRSSSGVSSHLSKDFSLREWSYSSVY